MAYNYYYPIYIIQNAQIIRIKAMLYPLSTPSSTPSTHHAELVGTAWQTTVEVEVRGLRTGNWCSASSNRNSQANFPSEIRRHRQQSRMAYLSDEQKLFVQTQFDAVLAKLELVLSQYSTSLTGDHVLAATTTKQYASIFNALSLFLQRIGDYESLFSTTELRRSFALL